MYTTPQIYDTAFYSGLLPDAILKISEWAEKNRTLTTKEAAEPGPWRNEKTPYLVPIMDDLSSDSDITVVVFMKGTQIGGTEVGQNFIGYTIDHDPCPMMLVTADEDLVKTHSKVRIDPLIEENPRIKEKVSVKKEKGRGRSMGFIDFVGGFLRLVGARSPTGLRMLPIRKLIFEECDGYVTDCGNEGDPCKLAEKRTTTFGAKKKIYYNSTPTLKSTSRIEPAYMATDQKKCWVPCPDCNEYQQLKFENLVYDNNEKEVIGEVKYACEHCGVLIEERNKTWMLARYDWRPDNPGAGDGKKSGYWMSTLYSPYGWHSWKEIVEDFLDATVPVTDWEKLKTFKNTILAETFTEEGETPDYERLFERQENYELGNIQNGVCFITCGMDIQKDRIEAEIIGHGRDRATWLIDYVVLIGDTEKPEVWEKARNLINRSYKYTINKKNYLFPINFTLVDSGYEADLVYVFCKTFPSNKVAPSKGYDDLPQMVGIPSAKDITTSGKKKRRGIRVWPIGASYGKKALYGRLRLPAPDKGEAHPAGYCHFGQVGKEYFRQLTGEELRAVRTKRGRIKYEWHRIRRNEVLDCRIMNMAAGHILGINDLTPEEWDVIESTLESRGALQVEKKPARKKKNKHENKKEEKQQESSYWG